MQLYNEESKRVYIVGIGPGHRDFMLPRAVEIIEKSNVVIGFKRALDSIGFVSTPKKQLEGLKETLSFLEDNKDKVISIAASGDPCFYGVTDFISRNYKGDFQVIPGISSFQYLFAKLKKSWNTAFLGSLHGREQNFIEVVRGKELSFWLTDKVNSPSSLAAKLLEEEINCIMYVGENLSYEDEKITTAKPEEISHMRFSELSVVIIEKRGE
jgi:cobalt-precorrin-7 (C5)-methyltransferase